ncbi:site-specific DNA-methyltransferase [Anabaena sp. FACHB-1237]|uniref:DNA-methyltransferase n=1 Tax=Anabaena sp. FACHB-1237 TaxID=2692769 RepID=UPI00168116B5|nr:site-specific DNA-methyltransferase [Anabaena sp. FACHB-1237]MBD2138554.1 site-specific DNA-methyltransferase [Anabaena sp. FACHB-1237]
MKYLNQIIHGDCIEKLKEIPDKSIDLVILDPPYWKVIQEKWDYQWRTEEDYVQWCLQWLEQIARVIKLSGSLYLFGYVRNLVHLYDYLIKLGFDFRQQIIIDKGIKSIGGRATKGYKMFPNVTESLLFFNYNSRPFVKKFLKDRQKELGLTALAINQKLGVKVNGGGMWSLYTGNNILAQIPTKEMWEKLQEILDFQLAYENIAPVFNIEMGITDVWKDINFYKEERFHPTQKPVKLIERIIKASSHENMVVLDPFMGSGTTAVVCLNLSRYYIGIEKEEKYIEVAKKRIDRR